MTGAPGRRKSFGTFNLALERVSSTRSAEPWRHRSRRLGSELQPAAGRQAQNRGCEGGRARCGHRGGEVTSARLYADENVPRHVVEALRRLGHDVLTCYEAGNAGQRIPDDEVLRFATAHGRAVLTMNRRDFIRLDRKVRSHAGIVACTEDADSEGQAVRIHDAITAQGELRDRVVRVNRPPAG